MKKYQGSFNKNTTENFLTVYLILVLLICIVYLKFLDF